MSLRIAIALYPSSKRFSQELKAIVKLGFQSQLISWNIVWVDYITSVSIIERIVLTLNVIYVFL